MKDTQLAEKLERLCRAERERMISFAIRRRVAVDFAEDVVQQAQSKFMHSFDPEKGVTPKTWLYGLMKTSILEHNRKYRSVTRSGKPNVNFRRFSEVDAHEIESLSNSHERSITDRMFTESLEADLASRLTETEREIMRLLIHEGLTEAEIARRIKRSPSRVNQLREVIRRHLSQVLAGQCG